MPADQKIQPSRIARTVGEATPIWEPAPRPGPGAPNVLLVVLDDTGWSDFGCFGSEIATTTIDRLAGDGARYTNFHVTPLCSPTRACLMTGRNHHAVGMRFLADTDTGYPNSRGRIDPAVPLLPQQLRDAGYGTYLVGKWHLTPLHEINPAGPFDNWPLARGFNRYYGYLDGCTDQMCPELYEDNHPVRPPDRPDYHLSEDLADRAIGFIRDHRVFRPDRPFYLQLALGAVHAPFQVPRRYIDKYLDTFTKGWDRTRRDRLDRQIATGLCPPTTRLTPRNPGVGPWDDLSDDERLLYVHLQATFAGFLEHADEQIGRIVEHLRAHEMLDDTVVLVMSDNGASREGGRDGAVDTNGTYGGIPQSVAQHLSRLDRLGGADGPAHYPEGWGMAGNTPFRRYKQFVDLGGVRSPLVVRWPAGIAHGGAVRRQFVHAIDIAPTILELAGLKPAAPMDGVSITSTFADPSASNPRATQYFEMFGHRAIWHQGWAAVTTHRPGDRYEDDDWRLYDTVADFSEVDDLAAERPDKLSELTTLWEEEAEANGVFPLDDRSLVELLALRTDQGLMGRSVLVLEPGQSHVPYASTVTGTERSMTVSARLRDHGGDGDGVILASGNSTGGYVLYLRDDTPVFEHLVLDERTVCRAPRPLGRGAHSVGFRLDRRPDRSATVGLQVDGLTVASAPVPTTSAHISFFGMDVGRDPRSRISSAYPGEFPLPDGRLVDVTVEFLTEPNLAEMAESIEGTE